MISTPIIRRSIRYYYRLFSHENKNDSWKTEPLKVTFEDVSRANYAIRNGIIRTHCDHSIALSELCGSEIYLKKDFMQRTGSFKERGARNALMALSDEERKNGAVCASAGNHALALAWHGKDLGIPITCVMPVNAPFAKVDKCRKYGANVVLHGEHIGAAKEFANKEFLKEKYINGYDDPEICAGCFKFPLLSSITLFSRCWHDGD